MVELVDTPDLKSCVRKDVRVQVPLRVLKLQQSVEAFFIKTLVKGFHLSLVKLNPIRLFDVWDFSF